MKNPTPVFKLAWLVCFAIFAFSFADCDLTFLETPRDTKVGKSSEVYFVCRFGGVPSGSESEYSFKWLKGNETILVVNQLADNPTVSSVKLIKYDTEFSSSVTCRVTGPDGKFISHTCQLTVLANPSSSPNFPTVEMLSGSYKSLQVNTNRQPIRVEVKPLTSMNEYRWFKDHIPLEFYADYDNYILYTNGSLEIKKVTEGVNGGYNLQVTTSSGTVLSSETRIYARERKYQPSFIRPYLPDQIVLKKGESRTLNCSANAAPIPKIKWYRSIGDFEEIVPQQDLREQAYRTSYYLSDVRQNQTLRCKVVSGSWTPIEKSVKVIVLEPPGEPIQLKLDPDIHTAVVRWVPTSPDPHNCTVYYKNISVPSGNWGFSPSDKLSSTTLKSLAPFTSYSVKVACTNDVGQGHNSSEGTMMTGEFTPSPPVDLHAKYVEVDGVKIVEITWQEPLQPNGEITYYNFYYTEDNNRDEDISRWQKRTTKNLYYPEKYTPGKFMVAKAQAVNNYGPSDLSDIYSFPTTVGVPGLMEKFSAEPMSSNAVNLSWSRVALIDIREIKSYRVHFNDSATEGATKRSELSPSEVSHSSDGRYYVTVRGLQPGTKYSFKIAANNFNDESGPFTELIVCSTLKAVPSTKPGDLKSRIINLNSIYLSWAYGVRNDKITNYTVLYRMTKLDDPPIVPVDSNIVYFQKLNVLESSVTVQGLEESSCYDFFVCANNAIGRGPISTNQRICTIDLQDISAPVIKSIEVINSTSVRLHWTVPEDYKSIEDNLKIGFQISYKKTATDQSISKLYDCMGSDLTSCVLTGLLPDTSYAFQLSILLVSNESPKSNTYNVKTKSPEPNTPYNLKVLIKDEGVRISWDYTEIPEHLVTSFIIKYEVMERNERYEYVHDVRDIREELLKRQVNFPDLRKGLKYVFRVQARNLNGYSLLSEPQIIEVPATVPTGVPLDVKAIALSESRIFVSWNAPDIDLQNGIITSYLLQYSQGGTSFSQTSEVAGEALRTVINNLLPGERYVVKVAARNSAGNGPFSNKVETRTFATNASAPQNVRVAPLSKVGSIKVSWDKPFDSVSSMDYGYKVFYSSNPSLALTKWHTKSVPQKFVMETNLDGLLENTLYGIRVAAQVDNVGSPGALSRQVLHRIGPVLHDNFDLKPIKIEPNYVIFQWKKPAGVSVTQYQLRYFNMRDANADKGLITMTENATLCLVSGLKAFTQYSFNMSALSLDAIGNEINNLSVQYTLFTKATVPVTVASPTLSDSNTVTSSGVVTLSLTKPSLDEGPVDAYQVVLVEILDSRVTLADLPEPSKIFIENDYSHIEIPVFRRRARSPSYLSTQFRAVIVAQVSDFYSTFSLGDNRYYGDFFNAPLKFSSTYTVFIRALVYSDVVLYRCSGYMDPAFSVKGVMGDNMTAGMPRKDPFVNLLWIVGVVATVIIVIVIILIAIYLLKRSRQSSPLFLEGGSMNGSGKFEGNMLNGGKYYPSYSQGSPAPHSPSSIHMQNNGFPPLYSANYKTMQTDDPVEKRRLNFPTNGLEDHPPLLCMEVPELVDRLKAKDNYLFNVEFESIEPVQQFTWEHSNMEVNKSKNRYANVIAYDHSRVRLKTLDGVPGSDYINANFMDGYRREKAYISTQGPLDETLGDFWRMVWEQNSCTVVMMTKLEEKSRTKCDRYWPEKSGESQTFGLIEVYLVSVEVFASHTIRYFKIRHVHEPSMQRDVKQFQFTDWPDHGVPEYATPVLAFVKKVKLFNPSEAGPIVVHCSAGVGRTGCFIVIDTQLEKILHDDQIDIYGHVTCLRAQRQYMVQTEDQYIFIYDAILEAIYTGNTEFRKYEFEDAMHRLRSSGDVPGDNRTGLETEFEKLSNVTHSPAKFSAAMLPENMSKNRLANIKPFDSTRVKLQPLRGQAGSDYINASYIDSYFKKGAYIATQGPLETTVFDFWRMIWEQNSSTIVMLTKLKELGREKCFQYWPKPNHAERHNYLLVEPVQEYSMAHFVMREFRLCDAREGIPRRIQQFHFDWPEQGVPKQNQAFVEFIRYVEKTQPQGSFGPTGPIVVHCSSGSARTGVYIALKIVMDRMDCEAYVDVFQTVKLLRTQRPAMVQTEDQYEFIYQTALDYFRISDGFDYYNSSRC